jgi:hypothetical protein
MATWAATLPSPGWALAQRPGSGPALSGCLLDEPTHLSGRRRGDPPTFSSVLQAARKPTHVSVDLVGCLLTAG